MSATLVESQPVAQTPSEIRGERPFLTAQWRQLAMLNYEIDPAVLVPLTPAGTELDRWQGATFASLVGFLFRDTRIRGWAIPFHRNFAEVNLRFYVRRRTPEGWRRGVVFVRELVRLPLVSFIARWCFQENFLTVPLWHSVRHGKAEMEVRYGWRFAGREHALSVTTACSAQEACSARVGKPAPSAWQPLQPDTVEHFVAEHYWGYSAQRDGSTMEYRVAHPSWRVQPAIAARLDCDVAKLYGPQFAEFLVPQPPSAFLVEGSAVELFVGRTLMSVR